MSRCEARLAGREAAQAVSGQQQALVQRSPRQVRSVRGAAEEVHRLTG